MIFGLSCWSPMDPIMIEYLANMVLNPHHKNWEGGTLVEHIFLSCLLAQQVRCYVANIIWQLFAKRGNSSHQKSFSMMQCLLHQALCKTLKLFIAPSWGVSSHGIFGGNGMIWFLMLSMTCGEVTPRCVGLFAWLWKNWVATNSHKLGKSLRHGLSRCSWGI